MKRIERVKIGREMMGKMRQRRRRRMRRRESLLRKGEFKIGEMPAAHATHRSEAAQSSTSLPLNRNLKTGQNLPLRV